MIESYLYEGVHSLWFVSAYNFLRIGPKAPTLIKHVNVEDDSDGKHEFTDREYQEYNRQITESDVIPLYNFDAIADDLKSFSELALKEYNEKEHTNLEFVKAVKVNLAGVAGFLYYITFDVRDAAAVDGGTMEFQAFVWDGIAHIEVGYDGHIFLQGGILPQPLGLSWSKPH
ncbi:hypothetical protein CsSME_00042779 [Camellia sinensis var. sinensis]